MKYAMTVKPKSLKDKRVMKVRFCYIMECVIIVVINSRLKIVANNCGHAGLLALIHNTVEPLVMSWSQPYFFNLP